MQGVTLLAGLALLGSLAVPAGLLASEQAPDPVAGEVAPVGPDEAAEEVPATQPAPEVEATVAATRTVAMQDNFFKPKRITIDPGDTLQWDNRGEVDHNAIGENGRFETPTIGPGESSSHTFDREGRFPYFCSIHQGMTGTIQVGASSGGGGGAGGGGSGGTTGSGGSSGSFGSSGSSGSTSSGGSGTFGSSSSSGGSSSLASTGSELLWLGLTGYGLLALGAFIGLGAISRRA
jgi:plastocyanin